MSIKITIPNVTGNIVITAKASNSKHYNITQYSPVGDITTSAVYTYYKKFFTNVENTNIIIPGLGTSPMTPQGMSHYGDYIYVTAYDHTKKDFSCVYIINYNTGILVKTLWLKDSFNHVGGVATDGTYLYVCCNHRIGVIKLTTLHNAKDGDDVVLTYIPVKTDKGSKLSCSFCSYDSYKKLLWVGTFNAEKADNAFGFKTNGTKSLTLSTKIGVPAKTQGICFESDKVYFSISYGRNASSTLHRCSLTKGSTSKNVTKYTYKIINTIEAPATSEGIFIADNKLYILFENAALHYYQDTATPTKRPIDRICDYKLSAISSPSLKDFPYADQLVEIAMTYYRNADKEYVSSKSWSQGTTYRASNTPLSYYCESSMDVKNSFWVAKSGKHYKAIDCSTLVGLCLRGYKYEEGPYASKAKFDTFRTNRNQTNPTVSWAFSVPRTAAEIGEYCANKGWIVPISSIGSASDNYSGLKKGDLIFWAKKDSNGKYKEPDRYMHISHVAIVYGNSSTYSNRLAVIESTSTTTKQHTLSNGSTLNCGVRIKDIANNVPDEIVLVARIQV